MPPSDILCNISVYQLFLPMMITFPDGRGRLIRSHGEKKVYFVAWRKRRIRTANPRDFRMRNETWQHEAHLAGNEPREPLQPPPPPPPHDTDAFKTADRMHPRGLKHWP